jgi:ribosomal protein S18 acetylase RimI-like enzyme
VSDRIHTFDIELLDARATAKIATEVVRVRQEVYSDTAYNRPSSGIDFATAVLPAHLARKEFSFAAARDETGTLVGYCYGYVGDHGQFWTDYVAERIHPSLEKAWLGDHFEIVELAIVRSARGIGVGRDLLTTLLDAHGDDRRALLTLAKTSSALGLYESLGFTPFGEFENFVLLGRRQS